jgi:DNA-binding SARP family transcriptional activator
VSVETRRSTTSRKPSGGLAIRLLGEIRLQRDEATIALPASKRTRALLGFLVATATAHSRQTLCDLLWDGPDDPRAALRWSLTKLRPLVNEGALERLNADRERVAFMPEGARVDVRHVEALLTADLAAAPLGELEVAAGLLQGEFLDGLDLPSCYRFHHWCLAERERWGSLRRKVLAITADRLAGEPERALPYTRAMVAADPLSEAAHGRLVALLDALGRRKEAQDHYDYARALLQRELGARLVGDLKAPVAPRRVAPGEGRDPRADAVAAEATPPAAPIAAAPGLVGRVAEQAAARAALAALCAGTASPGLLFVGEPGIGKSALLAFVADEAARSGVRLLSARCFESEAVRPYGCWADALRPAIEAESDPAARRSLALFVTSAEASRDDEGSRNRVFAAVTDLLGAAAAKQPIILMIDDLQWIDEGSASLLHYVLRTLGPSSRLAFAGSARADEIDDNPWCKRVVAAMLEGGAVKRMALAPLGADEAAQFFAASARAGDIAAASRQSGGNPLFLTELARAERQGIASSGRDLDALIDARIARLDDAARDLIVYASATVRDFKPELLGAAMDLPETRLMERIDRLERGGLLKPSGEGRFDFAHDLIRQATYRSLSQPRRRLIHRQIARALDAAAQIDDALWGELAFHAGAAGEHALAVKASIAAGEHCLRVFANSAAVDAADRGLGHLQQLAPGPERAHAHIALLKVKVFAAASPGIRSRPKMFEDLQKAVETAELMGLRDDDAALGWHMISWSSQRANDASGARKAILLAEERSRPAAERARCQQLANTGRCLLEVEFDIPRARDFLREAGQIAEALKLNLVELDWGRGLIARWDGDLTGAQASMQRALALARLRQDRWREMECLVWLAKVAIESEQFHEACALCDEIDTVAARIGDGPAPVADALRAIARMMSGDEEREPEMDRTLAALRALDDKAQLAYVLNEIAMWRLVHGRRAGASAAASEALRAAEAVQRATEIIVSNSLLARLGAPENEARDSPRSSQAPAKSGAADSSLSARARAFRDRAGAGAGIPTLIPTAPS